jgi:hypothetical protein
VIFEINRLFRLVITTEPDSDYSDWVGPVGGNISKYK